MEVGTSRLGTIHLASLEVLILTVCRETIKRILAFPADTNIVWKSHDDSIAQRTALDEARQQKTSSGPTHPGIEKRRQTLQDDSERGKGKSAS